MAITFLVRVSHLFWIHERHLSRPKGLAGRDGDGPGGLSSDPSIPRQETYGLIIQLRRAAVSIASNIAEGKGRSSDKELLHFLSNAKGSLFEVETQIMIADGLGYLTRPQCEDFLSRSAEVGRLLNGLMKAFRNMPAA